MGANIIKISGLLIIVTILLSQQLAAQKKRNNYLVSFSDTSRGASFGNVLYGYKTISGKIAIPAKYILVASTKFDKMAIVYTDSGWIGINRKDSFLLRPFIYDNGPDYFIEGLFRFVEFGKIGFANIDGVKIIPAMYDFVTSFKNGIAEFTLGGKKIKDGENWYWSQGYDGGFINKWGQLFNKVIPIDGKYAKACTNYNKNVFINKNGIIIK